MKRSLSYIMCPILIVVVSLVNSAVNGQTIRDDVEALNEIDVVEQLGDSIPLNLEFTNDRGEKVTLADYYDSERPVVLVLAYYSCPMLCNLVLNGLSAGVQQTGWTPGEQFRIVTVSFDPTETYELAAAKKKNYLAEAELDGVISGWDFLVGEESQSKALAEALGFKYYWDEQQEQYAHPAVIFLTSGDGKITRYLYGLEYAGNDLKLALLEASEGKVGSSLDRLILYCFHYDPDAGSYVVFAANVMKLGGAVSLLIFGLFLGLLWKRDRRRSAVKVSENDRLRS
ncbi:MAG: SCO family protein [bacterium]|nr:SCO family protein [bacterium]